MKKILRPDFLIKRENESFFLASKKHSNIKYGIHPLTALAMVHYDGTRTVDEIKRILIDKFKARENVAVRTINGINAAFGHLLLKEGNKTFTGFPATEYSLDTLFSRLSQTTLPAKKSRQPAPSVLMWWVTDSCIRRCKYCYAVDQLKNSHQHKLLAKERILRLVDEAFDIGVHTFMLTGGEPLQREDIFDIIRYILDRNMHVQFLTKYPLKDIEIKKIKHEKLHAAFSIDSHSPGVSAYLTGADNYLKEMTDAMDSMKQNNLPFGITVVVNRLNFRDIKTTVRFLADRGAGNIFLQQVNSDGNSLAPELAVTGEEYKRALDDAYEEVANIGQKNVFLSHRSNSDDEEEESCAIGLRKLFFRFDGKVMWCESAVTDPHLEVGDVKTQSIMDVWNSGKFLSFVFPEKKGFSGTVCFSCNKFNSCLSKTACIVASKKKHNKYFHPLRRITDLCSI